MEDLFDKMMKKDANFRKFVEVQKCKTTEEIAAEFGIKLVNTRNTQRDSVPNLCQILVKKV